MADDETVEPLAAAPPATGTGTSTGTTSLAVTAVTGTIVLGATITGTGVPAGTTLVAQVSGTKGGAGTYTTSAATTLTAIALTFTAGPTVPLFPDFTPIIPTSAFPPGGGIGSIGDPIGVPTYPPPTPPPIGTVPVGGLVGPAIAAAGVPPSLAGVVQPQYKTGSATTPATYFPEFTTTSAYTGFPNQPPAGVPIVFANISTNPSKTGGVWTVVTPPSTPTTGQIILNGWGPTLAAELDGAGGYEGVVDAGPVRSGHAKSAERYSGAVLPDPDTENLYQSQSPSYRGSKRMPKSNPARRSNHT